MLARPLPTDDGWTALRKCVAHMLAVGRDPRPDVHYRSVCFFAATPATKAVADAVAATVTVANPPTPLVEVRFAPYRWCDSRPCTGGLVADHLREHPLHVMAAMRTACERSPAFVPADWDAARLARHLAEDGDRFDRAATTIVPELLASRKAWRGFRVDDRKGATNGGREALDGRFIKMATLSSSSSSSSSPEENREDAKSSSSSSFMSPSPTSLPPAPSAFLSPPQVSPPLSLPTTTMRAVAEMLEFLVDLARGLVVRYAPGTLALLVEQHRSATALLDARLQKTRQEAIRDTAAIGIGVFPHMHDYYLGGAGMSHTGVGGIRAPVTDDSDDVQCARRERDRLANLANKSRDVAPRYHAQHTRHPTRAPHHPWTGSDFMRLVRSEQTWAVRSLLEAVVCGRWRVSQVAWSGYEPCPLSCAPDRLESSSSSSLSSSSPGSASEWRDRTDDRLACDYGAEDWVVENVRTRERIAVSSLACHAMSCHGFGQPPASPYALDYELLLRILFA